MHSAPVTLGDALADAVQSYRTDANAARLFDRLEALASDADVDALITAAEPFRDIPEVTGPLYERIVAQRAALETALRTLRGWRL